MTRDKVRQAEVLATTGAGVLGAGAGVLLSRWLGGFGLTLLVAGVTAHALGMWLRHRADTRAGVARAAWEAPLYWLCWALLAGAVVYAFVAAA